MVIMGAGIVSGLMMIKVVGSWHLPIQSDLEIHVLKNDTIYGVSKHLFSQNSIHHTWFLVVVYLDNSQNEDLHPGMYTIKNGMSYIDLVKILQSGKHV
jgi:cell division protein YceG involved in septum cleavage